jgi:NMD protein affecting ribosome stability and mRNA decay
MKLYPVINATMADGTMRSWFAGESDTIRESEAAIRTALAEARAANGVDVRIAFVEPDTGRCRYRVRVRT